MLKPEPAPTRLSTPRAQENRTMPQRNTTPTAEMMAPIERLARFMATRDAAQLDGVFADHGVTIHEKPGQIGSNCVMR